MSPRKKRRDPRQDKTGKYPSGFSRFGTPITCGVPTDYGECPEPRREGSGKCSYHLGLTDIEPERMGGAKRPDRARSQAWAEGHGDD